MPERPGGWPPTLYPSSNWDETTDFWPGYGEDSAKPRPWANGTPPPWPPSVNQLGAGAGPSAVQAWTGPFFHTGHLGGGAGLAAIHQAPGRQLGQLGGGAGPGAIQALAYHQVGQLGGGAGPAAVQGGAARQTGHLGGGANLQSLQIPAAVQYGSAGGGAGTSIRPVWERGETVTTQRTGSSAAALTLSFTQATTPGDVLVLVFTASWLIPAATYTVTDDQGNTWTQYRSTLNSSLNAHLAIWVARATTSGIPTVTVTPSKSVTISAAATRYTPPKSTVALDAANGQSVSLTSSAGTLAAASTATGDLWVAASATGTLAATAPPTTSAGFMRTSFTAPASSRFGITTADYGLGQTVASGFGGATVFGYAVSVNATTAIVAIKAT